jgi:hypothetical protein
MKAILELYIPYVDLEMDDLFTALHISEQDFYTWLDSFNMSMGVTLTPEFIEAKIPEVLSSRNMANNPFEVTAADIRRIYLSLI